MKNKLHKLLVLFGGSLVLVSCGTYNTAYVDDIYYNPKIEARQLAKQKNAESKVEQVITDSNEFHFSDYDDYEYSDRINKFHNEEYDGTYYNDEPEWNTNVSVGFGTYGPAYSIGFNYGYDPWYNPYFYSAWYPYHTPYYPWGYPYYGYYNPWHSSYYPMHCNSYFDWGHHYDNGRGYHYGQRMNGASGSPKEFEQIGNKVTRKNESNFNQGNANTNRYSDFKLQEDLAPIRVSSASRKTIEGSNSSSESKTNVKSIGVESPNKISSNLTQARAKEVSSTKTSSATQNSLSAPKPVLRNASGAETLSKPVYTRTRTEALKSIPASSAKDNYTPSFTRTRTTLNRNSYNTGSTYTPMPSRTNTTRTVNSIPSNNSGLTPRSTNSAIINSSTTPSKPRSSYTAPSRNSTPSYSPPPASNSNRSTGSSVSRSSSSTPSSSPAKSSTPSPSSSSPTRKGR